MTLPDVKSEILADDATNPAPPEILAPPLPSIIPVTVAIPLTVVLVVLTLVEVRLLAVRVVAVSAESVPTDVMFV